MVFNRFAAGRKTYGQGSYAPTRGQVNPAGYIQRELRRKNTQQGVSRIGADGQSDTRSGLAARALNRPVMGSGAVVPGMGSKPRPNTPQYGGQKGGGLKSGGGRGRPNGPRGGGNGGRTGGAVKSTTSPLGVNVQAPAPVTPPTIQVSPNGQLNLPYSGDLAAQALAAQQQFDDEMMTLNQESQGWDLEYQRGRRDLGENYEKRQDSSRNDAASNGVAFSSAYGNTINEDTREYNNANNDLESQNTFFKSSIDQRRNAAQAYMNQTMQQLAQQYADELASQAGSLGYGTSGAEGATGGSKSGGLKSGTKSGGKSGGPKHGTGVRTGGQGPGKYGHPGVKNTSPHKPRDNVTFAAPTRPNRTPDKGGKGKGKK